MELELIDYILELVGDSDIVCEELHKDSNEEDFCSRHCENLNGMCIRRLIYKRIFEKEQNVRKTEI
jgi:hypothetical protein